MLIENLFHYQQNGPGNKRNMRPILIYSADYIRPSNGNSESHSVDARFILQENPRYLEPGIPALYYSFSTDHRYEVDLAR